MAIGREWTSVRDPLTGDKRPISGVRTAWVSAQIRHDIPGTPFAWSAYADYGKYAKYFYLTEVFRSWEGPWFVGAYVEHKNVFGTTVRLSADNIFDGRHFFTRAVYSGYRDRSPISFIQLQDQLIGPICPLQRATGSVARPIQSPVCETVRRFVERRWRHGRPSCSV